MSQVQTSTPIENQYSAWSFASSLATGSLAKICVNNLNKTVARYQLGQFRPDMTFNSAKSQLFGASLQSLGVYKTREILGADQTDGSTASHVANFGKNFTAGVIGGLAMHPCCVPFYYMRTKPSQASFFPSIDAFKSLVAESPQVFKRGVGFRAMSTGLEFGIYFTLKNSLKDTFDNPVHHEFASSVFAILLAVPFHQKYIQAMNSEPTPKGSQSSLQTIVAALKPELKAPSARHTVAFLMFTVINMLELGILDMTKKQIDSYQF